MVIATYDCRASKKEIERELPKIRSLTLMPSDLEIAVAEGAANLPAGGDQGLKDRAIAAGRKFAMSATRPGTSDEATAELAAGLENQKYQSPLYQNGEPYRGEIFYRNGNGDYALME